MKLYNKAWASRQGERECVGVLTLIQVEFGVGSENGMEGKRNRERLNTGVAKVIETERTDRRPDVCPGCPLTRGNRDGLDRRQMGELGLD